MPVFPYVSDPTLLHGIWRLSYLMAGAAVCVLMILIIRRTWQNYWQKRTQRRRDAFARVMRAGLNKTVELSEASLPRCRHRDIPIICGVALDMLRPLHGEEVNRIITMLELWQVRPYLYRLLKHGARGECIRALTLLAHFTDKGSLQTLLKYAADEDIYVQLAALHGLALSKNVEHLPKALNGLVYSKQHNTLMLADILRHFGAPAVEPLIMLIEGAAAREVRLAAIMALGAIGAIEAVEPLLVFATDPDIEVRAQILATLGRLRDPRAKNVVLAALEEKDRAIVVKAIQAAGALELQAAMPLLVERLSDDDWWVRYRAAEALVKLGSPGLAMLHAMAREEGMAGEIATQLLAEKETHAI